MTKVFCIGMFKTVTSTMGTSLHMLGYNVFLSGWKKDEIFQDNWNREPEKWVPHYETIRKKTELYMTALRITHGCFVINNVMNGIRSSESDIPLPKRFIDRYEKQFKESSIFALIPSILLKPLSRHKDSLNFLFFSCLPASCIITIFINPSSFLVF